ncbi:DUF6340 family protein [Maribacter algicola]|nr:DUF6340 family protein [Maribacter algicola]
MRYNTNIFIIIIVVSLFMACSTTKELSILVQEPSPVTITNQIKTIGIIDATKPYLEKRKKKGGLASIAAQDEKWLGIHGTEASMEGLFDALLKDQRFENVLMIQHANIAQSLSDTQLNADTWQEIASLCDEIGVDAIFALAYFEVDTKLKVKKTSFQQTDLLRMQEESEGKQITMETLIENGWRIFDPKNRILLDEIITNDELVTSSSGNDVVDAFENMENRRRDALRLSKNTGKTYGQRLLPTERILKRTYFAKGNDRLIKSDRLIQEGKINLAIQELSPLVLDADTNLGSKASYNLAVLKEYQGNLDMALQWAEKSIDIKSKAFNTDYLKSLQRRITKNVLVQQQFQEVGFLE